MDRIQLRIHPSVGMARIGRSPDWYFLGPEIPRHIQEQYPNLRQKPVPLRHPNGSSSAPAPDDNRYRDKAGHTMPQAARFRVFAYFYTPGIAEPYKVLELKPEHADIEWKVTLANQKGVDAAGHVSPNAPAAVTLSTKAVTAHQKCEVAGKPNLGWAALEKNTSGVPTNRLHVIGNEGAADGVLPFRRAPSSGGSLGGTFLYQNDWQDTAADGPVEATVELKAGFTTAFPGFKFLIPGTADAQSLPSDKKVKALPAWAVVNMPDYVPDMGHFVSIWDLALNQSWKHVMNGNVRPVVGRHALVTEAGEAGSYAFYDYFTHVYPQLALFTDVAHTSGQARAASHSSGATNFFSTGIQIDTALAASPLPATISVPKIEALKMKAAAQGAPFQVTISDDPNDPLAAANTHEFAVCTSVDDDGTLHVTRTAPVAWSAGHFVFASAKGGAFTVARLGEKVDLATADTIQIEIDVQSAHRMPLPTPAGANERDKTFKLAITDMTEVEWFACSKIEYVDKAGTMVAKLTVARKQDGTVKREWAIATSTVIAPATGHKGLNSRARTQALYRSARGPLHEMIFKRLRKPATLYERTTFKKHETAGDTVFPREFGRRQDIGAVSTDADFNGDQNVDPGGSVARYHDRFKALRNGGACRGQPMSPDDPPLPAEILLPGEDYDVGPDAVTRIEHARQLDDYYWIVSQSDMPLLKELALTHIQYNHFEYWATNKVTKGLKPRWAPNFEVHLQDASLANFFAQAHTREEYIDKLFKSRPRYAPAFLDMASMGRMLGGSFLPGIEVGREAGIPSNWSLFHGGTSYFPDVRFLPTPNISDAVNAAIPLDQPIPEPPAHSPGQLTKDLAVPWFADFIACGETFWPTSRPSIVQQENGPAYDWMPPEADTDDASLIAYWTKLGFIRRGAGDVFRETETQFEHP